MLKSDIWSYCQGGFNLDQLSLQGGNFWWVMKNKFGNPPVTNTYIKCIISEDIEPFTNNAIYTLFQSTFFF